MCAPTRRVRDFHQPSASGWPTASPPRIGTYRDTVLRTTLARAAAGRIGVPGRDLSARSDVPRQGRRERGRSVLPRDGLAASFDLFAEGAAPLHAEDAERSTSAWFWRARSPWCSTPRRFISRPATRWCSAAPIMRGAIDRTSRVASRFPRTTQELDGQAEKRR